MHGETEGDRADSQSDGGGDDDIDPTTDTTLDIDPDGPFADVLPDREPAIPDDVPAQLYRQVRVAPLSVDVDKLPKVLVECGCGDCPTVADPLHDIGTESFDDVRAPENWAQQTCDQARPMTLERAAKAYYVYQTADYRTTDRTSRCERAANKHAAVMDAERDLLTDWRPDNTSLALLSLRPRPVEEAPPGGHPRGGANYDVERKSGPATEADTSTAQSHALPEHSDQGATYDEDGALILSDGRRWVPHAELAEDVVSAWSPNVRQQVSNYLGKFEDYECLWAVTTTDDAAAPHLHVICWVRDPESQLHCTDLEPAVRSFVRASDYAVDSDHPVVPGESDAAVVSTDPATMDQIPEDQLLHILRERDGEPYQINTAALGYVMHQREGWVMRRLHEQGATIDDERGDLDGGAVLWASSRDSIGASRGFDTSQ